MARPLSELSVDTVMEVVRLLSSVADRNIAMVSAGQCDEVVRVKYRGFHEGLVFSCADGSLPCPLEKYLDPTT